MTYALGVDLGTTFTAAAVCESGAMPRPVKLGDNTDAVPSVVFDRGEDLLFGEKAQLRAASDPTSVIRYAKSRLGSDTEIVAGGRSHRPVDVMGSALSWVLDKVEKLQGEAPASVTLTHPAHWGQHHLACLEAVAAFAGIDKPTFLSEPEAAGIQYVNSERVEPDELIGVYDLGGGTFDGAIIRRTAIGFALQGKPSGLDYVGGNVFDDVIFEHICSNVDLSAMDDTPATTAAAYALRDRCRDAKRLLSEDTVADVPVLFADLNTSIRLNRVEFESLIMPRVNATVELFGAVIRSAGVESGDLRGVLMVGGSSRIPLVSQMLKAAVDCPLLFDLEPKMVVASGAAASAARDLEQLPSLHPVGAKVAPPPTAEPIQPDPVVVGDVASASLADVSIEHAAAPRTAAEQLLSDGITFIPDRSTGAPAPYAPAPHATAPHAPAAHATPAHDTETSGATFDLLGVSAESRHRPVISPTAALTQPPPTQTMAIETLPSTPGLSTKLAAVGVVVVVALVVVIAIVLAN